MPENVAFPNGKKKVRYAVPNIAGTEWACEHCHEIWDRDSLFPAEEGTSLETILENHVLGVLQKVEDCMDEDVALSERLTEIGKDLIADAEAIGNMLGSRHWATVRLLELWCQSLRLQMMGTGASSKQLARPKAKAVTEYCQKVDLIWSFCAEAGLCPSHLHGLFVQYWPSGMLQDKFLACILYCHAMVSCYADGWPGLLAKLKLPTAGSKAADFLRSFGQKAMEAQQFGEAKLFFTAALRFVPEDNTLHSELSLALQKWGQAEKAAAAAGHCIRLYPRWAQGHYCMALALQLAGKTEEARAAGHKALELEPSEETRKLLAEM